MKQLLQEIILLFSPHCISFHYWVLIMGIIGDFMYSLIDPRIDFESRE